MLTTSDIEHLLRRTEFVARPERVAELASMSKDDIVDDILAVPADPGAVTFTSTENWRRGEELTHFWLDRMAHDSPRPIQEKMSLFWHNHFCSEFTKVNSAELMREQIDGFRVGALGDLRSLATGMATQVAMLRYLDNNQNRRTSPNQNFARELMELFLLGVGNYTEADVEAATAAWTGHSDDWQTDGYVWQDGWHDATPKQFLGRTINTDASSVAARRLHGEETIAVILDGAPTGGVVPAGASNVANRGRPTRDVAAEFVSRKLWTAFAGTTPPSAVVSAMRDTALATEFDLRPCLREMLTSDEFYTPEVKQGLVRSPIEFVVAALVATGRRSAAASPLWLMEGMGQRPLFPPNVAGWKHNGYWIGASAMSRRIETARNIAWRTMTGYWNGDGLIHLAGGSISKDEIEQTYANDPVDLLDRILALMRLTPTASTYAALRDYVAAAPRWERYEVVFLILISPDLHMA